MASRMDPVLAQLLQAAAAADSSTPTNQTVGANGEANASFEGFITALGLKLREEGVLGEKNIVEWENVAGEVHELVRGYFSGSEKTVHTLVMESLNNALSARLETRVDPTSAVIFAYAGLVGFNPGTRQLIDNFGKSSFVQLVRPWQEPRRALILTGAVTGAGVAGALGSGPPPGPSTWKATRTGVGNYVIQLQAEAEEWTNPPSVVANDIQGTKRTASVSAVTTNSFTVTMSNGTGANEDIQFSFIAIG